MLEMGVGYAFAITEFERFNLAGIQHLRQPGMLHRRQTVAYRIIAQSHVSECAAMRIGDGEETLQEFVRVGSTPDRQEVDDLDEQPGLAGARLAHGLDEL